MTPRDLSARVLDALSAHWTGREVIVLLSVFDGAARTLFEELSRVGARVSAVVTGAAPAPDAPPVPRVWDCSRHGPALSRDAFDRWLHDPPPRFARWLDAFDPGRTHAVLGSTFTHTGTVAGRPVHGRRRPRWAAWEDKTRIDALWSRTKVPAPRCTVLPLDDPGLRDTVSALDAGLGVVLAMDASTGFRGDATGLRWVRSAGEREAALQWMRGRTERVRMAEFVTGTPCSVLAMVLADGVAVFDPIEIVTVADTRTATLTFCGSSTRWRPGPQAAAELRGHARRAGAHLAENAGYRGMFSVDGILTERGVLATELNPRHASGLGLRAGLPHFPVYLFQRAVQEGLPELFGIRSAAVEESFREVVRRHPSHSVRIPGPPVPAPDTRPSRLVTVDAPVPVWQDVRYLTGSAGTRVLSVEPELPDGALGPAVAALARSLGRPDAVSPWRPPDRPAPMAPALIEAEGESHH